MKGCQGMHDLSELEKAFDRGLNAWEEEIVVNQAKKMGQRAADECAKLTKVVTGTMRRSWFYKIDHKNKQINIWISNPMEYAPHVNNGHRVVRAKKQLVMPKESTGLNMVLRIIRFITLKMTLMKCLINFRRL